MASNPLFDQLLLIALVLLCLLVPLALPDDPPRVPKTPLASKPRRRQRSREPRPFTGFIHQPRGEACEQKTDTRPQAPGSSPPVITCTRGRRRTVDTQTHFCPDPDGSSYGWLGPGNLRANGHPGAKPWRQFQCLSCHGYFHENHGTILHGKHASADLIVWVIACLAEGLGIRGTARGFGIGANTVLPGLGEAAEQLRALSDYFLHERHIHQVQLDELYAVLSALRDGEVNEAEAMEPLSRSPHWVWTASDPESKLRLCAQVGEGTLARAQAVRHQVTQVLAPGCVPLCLSDGDGHSRIAIVTHFGCWVQPPRKQATGPVPRSRWLPPPALL